MKKKLLKNWVAIGSISLALGAGIYGYSCSDGWWGYSYSSSFTPEAFAEKSYYPMFYTPYEFFYGGAYLDSSNIFNEKISEDWETYLGNAMSKEQINAYLLSKEDNYSSIEDLYAQISQKKTLRVGGFTWDLKNQKVVNFITFLYFAKPIEYYSDSRYDYWDYDSYVPKQMAENNVLTVEDYYKTMPKNDRFFSNRMWFQVIKAKFYSVNRFDVVSYFKTTAKNQPKNDLYYRALAYVGGAYYADKDFEKANLAFAEVFNASPSLRQTALYNYRPLSKDQVKALVAYAKDKDVKAALWAMQGYYQKNNVLEAIQELYAVNPGSQHIDFLLTRWVNEQEEVVLMYNEKGYDNPTAYFKKIESKVDKQGLAWINKIAKSPEKLHTPALWLLAGGYLDIFLGNYTQASTAFEKAKKQPNTNTLITQQIRLFEMINTISQLKKIDKAAEEKITADMEWLFITLAQLSGQEEFRHEFAKTWIKKYLADVYKNQGDLVRSEVAYAADGFYLKEDNINALEQYFKTGKKSLLDKVLVAQYAYTLNDIKENKALHYFYEDKIDEAIVEMKQTVPEPKSEWDRRYKDQQLYGNPFNGKIQDCNDCDHLAPQSVKYTKLSFLEKVAEMQDRIRKGEDVFNNALLVGNAFYNATFFGNARVFYNSALTGDSYTYIKPEYQEMLLSMKNARKYYTIAKKAAMTEEQKAKMAYLSAKLDRNDFYRNNYFEGDYFYGAGYDKVVFKEWDGFKELATRYKDTKYYQEVIASCGYFKTYVDKRTP